MLSCNPVQWGLLCALHPFLKVSLTIIVMPFCPHKHFVAWFREIVVFQFVTDLCGSWTWQCFPNTRRCPVCCVVTVWPVWRVVTVQGPLPPHMLLLHALGQCALLFTKHFIFQICFLLLSGIDILQTIHSLHQKICTTHCRLCTWRNCGGASVNPSSTACLQCARIVDTQCTQIVCTETVCTLCAYCVHAGIER